MKPKTLKPWDFVKSLKHDTSSIKKLGYNPNPEDYYYQLDISGNIYTPVVLVKDFDEVIPKK